MGDLPPAEVGSQPDEAQLSAGIAAGIKDSHFAPPIEVSDVVRARPSSTPPWMVCIRSGTSDEARRLTYAAFFGKDSSGKDGQYLASHYSAYADNCATQAYHLYVEPVPSPSPSPSPVVEPKKHHRHQQ
jgi:hypothetical protein